MDKVTVKAECERCGAIHEYSNTDKRTEDGKFPCKDCGNVGGLWLVHEYEGEQA